MEVFFVGADLNINQQIDGPAGEFDAVAVLAQKTRSSGIFFICLIVIFLGRVVTAAFNFPGACFSPFNTHGPFPKVPSSLEKAHGPSAATEVASVGTLLLFFWVLKEGALRPLLGMTGSSIRVDSTPKKSFVVMGKGVGQTIGKRL
jgi:hypothetical protein